MNTVNMVLRCYQKSMVNMVNMVNMVLRCYQKSMVNMVNKVLRWQVVESHEQGENGVEIL